MGIDWTEIERGSEKHPCLFDFYAKGAERAAQLALLDGDDSPARREMLDKALSEIVRAYCAFRMAKENRGFGLVGKGDRVEKMRASGRACAEQLIDKGIGPADVLYRLAQPGALAFTKSHMTIPPWVIFTSVKIVDSTGRRPKSKADKAKIEAAGAPAKSQGAVTHSFSKPSERASSNLRSVLEDKFGKATIDAIDLDDGQLFIKVESRARELKQNPRLFVPKAYAHIVKWYMQEHVREDSE